ncbi:MHS family proline/betaine transporter-like MFS transporter [Amycolatopsis echigonensis]|uniref:Putative proline/betaine transporter n=1 Tax=Amycolatopsis echigonensis TaxID=2576905 RepID=A0A2N3WJS2_9PSEU|nr:MFS transporter [Amycolatopsis niigatensis]PKV94120.1 MHS family proline/betaine transporter-like MFS transporter [Amycolatopsis niigatensis]
MNTSATKTRSATVTRRAVAAAVIGNALEWFDIAVYALMAGYIGKMFFPGHNPGIQLVEAYAVFGITFLIRPLGALVLGSYADRRGRRRALVVTIRLMVAGTFLLAILPGYDTIGVFAPIGVIVARLLQGFAAGGEFGAATSFLIEHDDRRKGFLGSFQFASQGLATLLSSAFAAGLTALLPAAEMTSWGWRVPFVFGLLVGPVGYYLRRHVDEAPRPKEDRPESAVREVFRRNWGGLLIAGGALVVSTSLNFILQSLPAFAIKNLGLNASASFAALLITSVLLTLVPPVAGLMSDRYGRIRMMAVAATVIGISVVPLYVWVTSARSFAVLAVAMAVLGLLKAVYFGPLPAVMADAFPARTRATGLAFSYNTAVGVFGGFTPAIATALVTTTGSPISPGYYLVATAAVSLAALFAAHRTRGIR